MLSNDHSILGVQIAQCKISQTDKEYTKTSFKATTNAMVPKCGGAPASFL